MSSDDGAHDDTVPKPALAPVTLGPASMPPAPVGVLGSQPPIADASDPAASGRTTLPRGADYATLLPADPEHYVLGDEIARGGMGRIIAARDRRLGRAVAIKELIDRSDAMRMRFEREVRISAKLQHPGTISILEAGAWPSGDLFYVMDLVGGQTLGAAIAACSSAEQRFGLLANVIAVVDTIAYAHSMRILHRDLKPGNILCGTFGETVVIDWGLAKDLRDPTSDSDLTCQPSLGDAPIETQAGLVIGTPAYMPPEQADGQPVDERADVYALGAILYHVLAGAPPYHGRTAAAILAEVTAGPPPALESRAPKTPPELVTIVGKAMARHPGERYESARELAAELKTFQTGQLVGSHRYTAGQLVRRWLRRHRAAVVVGGVAIALLATFGTLAVTRILRAQRAAEEQRALAEARGADAEELMAFMLGNLRDKLQTLGKLDVLDTVATKAVAYYDARVAGATDVQHRQRALALQNVGDVQQSGGDMKTAVASYRRAAAVWDELAQRHPLEPAFSFGVASTAAQIANVLIAQGDGKGARLEYERALARLGPLVASDPINLAWKYELVMTHRRLGDALVELGDVPGAIAQFRAAISIVEAARIPDVKWQRALAVNHSQLAGALLLQGDAAGSLAENRADLAISEKLAAANPKDTALQSDVAGAHARIGDVLRATGDKRAALVEFSQARDMAAKLVARDPSNADWQHDLAVSHDRTGHMLLETGDPTAALVQYQAAMALKRTLVERDPTNLDAQRNLAIGYNKVGNVYETRRDIAGALAQYRSGLAITEQLTKRDPANAGWQRDLAVSYYLVAEMLLAHKELPAALEKHRGSLAIVEKLVAKDPANIVWQGDLIESHTQIAKVLVAMKKKAEAKAELQTALAAANKLAEKAPEDPQLKAQIADLEKRIKALK